MSDVQFSCVSSRIPKTHCVGLALSYLFGENVVKYCYYSKTKVEILKIDLS